MNRPLPSAKAQPPAAPDSSDVEPKARKVRGPVGWLLGPELIGQLKKVLRKRSDPRDWMPYYRGCAHDECWKRDGSLTRVSAVAGGPDRYASGLHSENGLLAASAGTEASQVRRGAERLTQVAKPAPEQATEANSEIWLDYLSDAGDAVDSMYAVAYASLVSFHGDADPSTWQAASGTKLLSVAKAGETASLPRGQFVFFGGDTAYHVSDAATLRARVQEPFDWAFQDAKSHGHIAKETLSSQRTRRIYGIPGNHDWYDNIEGFSLVFRLGSDSANAGDTGGLPVRLPELERVQLASYVAIQLPFGWQMWGLDIDGGLDGRQQAYFESLASERLIIATPSPAIAFGASIAKKQHRDAASKLKLPLPTLPLASPAASSPRYRLDLSGDIHHYARYYPRAAGDTYGSVVSGLGGAFHHPSFTRASDSKEQLDPVRLYPTSQESRDHVADKLLAWKAGWVGSWARVVPFTLTLILGFAATYSKGGAWLLAQLLSALPGIHAAKMAEGPREMARSLLLLLAIAIAITGLWFAIAFGKRVYEKQLEDPSLAENIVDLWKNRGLARLFSPYRSYMYSWMIGFIALVPFALAPLWPPTAEASRLDLAVLLIVIGLPLACAYVGHSVAAHHLAKPLKWLLAAVGLTHALIQVITCLVFARFFTLSGPPIGAAVFAFLIATGGLYLARPLYKKESQFYTLVLALLPLFLFGLGMAPFIWLAQAPRAEGPAARFGWDSLRFVVSAAAVMPLGTTWLIWYLAVASRLNGHNNEAGSTARVTEFRQLIRFHLRADGLTGYVIAIHNSNDERAVNQAGKNLQFSLVDVFTLPTPPTHPRTPLASPIVGDLESGLSA